MSAADLAPEENQRSQHRETPGAPDKRRSRANSSSGVRPRRSAEEPVLRHGQKRVEREADDANPDHIGEHEIGPQSLSGRHDLISEPLRIDGDLDCDSDDERDAGCKPEGHENARQRRGDDNLRHSLRAGEPQRPGDLDQPRLDSATAARVRINSGQKHA